MNFRLLSVPSARHLLCSVQPAQLSRVVLLQGVNSCSGHKIVLILVASWKSYYQEKALTHRSSSSPQYEKPVKAAGVQWMWYSTFQIQLYIASVSYVQQI